MPTTRVDDEVGPADTAREDSSSTAAQDDALSSRGPWPVCSHSPMRNGPPGEGSCPANASARSRCSPLQQVYDGPPGLARARRAGPSPGRAAPAAGPARRRPPSPRSTVRPARDARRRSSRASPPRRDGRAGGVRDRPRGRGTGARCGSSSSAPRRRGTVELPLGALARPPSVRVAVPPRSREPADDRLLRRRAGPPPRTPPAGPSGMPGPSSRTETTHGRPSSSSSTHASASRPTWWRTLLRQDSTAASTSLACSAGSDRGRAGDGHVHLGALQPGEQLAEVLVTERPPRSPGSPAGRSHAAAPPARRRAVPAPRPSGPSSGARRCTSASTWSTPSCTTRASRCRSAAAAAARSARSRCAGHVLQQPGEEADDRPADDEQEDVAVGLLGELLADAQVGDARRPRRRPGRPPSATGSPTPAPRPSPRSRAASRSAPHP